MKTLTTTVVVSQPYKWVNKNTNALCALRAEMDKQGIPSLMKRSVGGMFELSVEHIEKQHREFCERACEYWSIS